MQLFPHSPVFPPKQTHHKSKSTTTMFQNYLKVAIRNSFKNKLTTSINILSLALGIAACLLIFLFIQDERSFDAFHQKNVQIYRLTEIQSFPGTNTQKVALSMPGMGPNMTKDYPEMLNFTRYMGRDKQLFENGDDRYLVEKMSIVDSTFLQIFDFELLAGNRETALNEPNSIVITEEIAKRFFGENEALNQSLKRGGNTYKITGVLADIPENSHLQFDVLLSIPTITSTDPEFNNRFGSNGLVTYFLMDKQANIKELESKMPDFMLRYMPPDPGDTDDVNDFYKILFQPLPDVHLASTTIEHDYQNYRKFNGSYLDIFAVVGFIILLIAGFNFMNLITARASHRWKEIGVRKTVGALKSQLFFQFIIEAMLLGVIAFLLALVIDRLFTPVLNTLVDRTLSFNYFFENPLLLVGAFGLTVLLGLLAGIYPSYYLSSFDASKVLKGGDVKQNKSIFRSGLVVVQFGLAIAMIVSTLVVVQQLWYMQDKDIGFNKDQILLIDMNDEANQKFATLKTELAQSSHVKGVTAAGQRLGNNFHQWGFKLRTDTIHPVTPSNVNVDFDYLEVYGMKLKDGRGFDKDRPTDNGYAFVINESLAKELNLDDPIGVDAGHSWYPDDTLGTIIGVVEDFNFNSLHYEINTLAMVVHPEWGYDEMSIKISGGNISAALADIEKTWNGMVPSYPFKYSFLEEHFDKLYSSDRQMESVIIVMAILAIFIACMGLFGLAAITTERKVKEIGIRKILGASMSQILVGLSKNFAVMILLAFVIFSPFTYFLMGRWLENFAYRIDISPSVFLIGGILALAIALLTISYHIVRSASRNPVHSLRHE